MVQPNTQARVGESHVVVGQILAAEDLRLAGRLVGRVDSTRTVIIEAGAVCEADVTAQRVVVEGVVIGDIQASGEVVIESSGQVKGSVRARNFRVRLGGRIAGAVETGVEVRLNRTLTPRPVVARTPVADVARAEEAPRAPQARPEPTPEPAPEPAAQTELGVAAAPTPEPEAEAAPTPEPEVEAADEGDTLVLSIADDAKSTEEVDIDPDADTAEDTLTDHQVVEIETTADEGSEEVVEDDDAEGVHAP